MRTRGRGRRKDPEQRHNPRSGCFILHPSSFILRRLVTVAALLWAAVLAGAFSAGRLTPQETRGKQIYLRGSSPSGQEIQALLGDDSLEVPGTTLPCASCHGYDGLGNPEGGVLPSNITWEALTKSYEITHASGRRHSAYDERTLARALADGVDPAGNRLLVAMPKYRMSRADLEDLIAYLKRLRQEQDPGLTETGLRVGTVLPAEGPLGEIGRDMKTVLAAYFAEVNAQGGIYNRRIELRCAEAADTATAIKQSAQRLVEQDQVFALVSPFIAGAEPEIAALGESEPLPVVCPFTLFPPVRFPPNRYVFYLFSGLWDQARALADFVGQNRSRHDPRIAVVYPDGITSAEIGKAVQEQCAKFGWRSPVKLNYARDRFDAVRLVQALRREGADAVFFFGSAAEGKALIREMGRMDRVPSLFLLSALAGRDILGIPPSLKDKIFLAYPTVPADQSRAGMIELGALLAKHRLSTRHFAYQLSAYCAAQVLVEGLKRAGKDLSREKLVTALEGLYEFETNLTRPITYGPNRRVGVLGAYVVAVDPEKGEFKPAGGWITPH